MSTPTMPKNIESGSSQERINIHLNLKKANVISTYIQNKKISGKSPNSSKNNKIGDNMGKNKEKINIFAKLKENAQKLAQRSRSKSREKSSLCSLQKNNTDNSKKERSLSNSSAFRTNCSPSPPKNSYNLNSLKQVLSKDKDKNMHLNLKRIKGDSINVTLNKSNDNDNKSKSDFSRGKSTPKYYEKRLSLSGSREELMEKLEKYKKKQKISNINSDSNGQLKKTNEKVDERSKSPDSINLSPRLKEPINKIKKIQKSDKINSLAIQNEQKLRVLKDAFLMNQNYYLNNNVRINLKKESQDNKTIKKDEELPRKSINDYLQNIPPKKTIKELCSSKTALLSTRVDQMDIVRKKSNNSIKSPRDKSNQGEKTIQEKKRKELKTASVPHNIIKIITKRISCYYSMTKTGFAHDKPKKFNQDNYFIHKNLCDNENSYFFGVCDGHGSNGHKVSEFIKENLPIFIDNELRKKQSLQSFNRKIKDVFNKINCNLITESAIDSQFSGSTCVSVFITEEKIISANVGDSRAILARCDKGKWSNIPLTRDHKPSEKDETLRIKSRKGRIEPFVNEHDKYVGPQRVWLMDQNIPGLAMSRSFGDLVASQVGVISEPEIFEFNYTSEDRFIIIASDGIWEFISNTECVNIVKDFYLINDIIGATSFLVEEATRRWQNEENVIDDITVIVIFFDI